MNRIIVYGIGRNESGEFGMNNKMNQKKLIKIKDVQCTSINVYNGNQYCIYAVVNDNYPYYYLCGINNYGQCGSNTYESIIKRTPIKSFSQYQNSINIAKICVNVSGSTTFWIDIHNQIYIHGKNSPNKTPSLAKKLLHLRQIIDLKSTHFYNILLCGTDSHIIVKYWCRISNINYIIQVPIDIINLAASFYGTSKIYSTIDNNHHYNNDNAKWSEMETFKNHNIIKIECGYYHSLFLESNGVVWSFGNNVYGVLGLGHNKQILNAQKITYFIDNNITIIDIKCGWYHNIAIDKNGNVFCWGYNIFGQCGDGTRKALYKPKLIKSLSTQNGIVDIGCGAFHSYAKTSDNKHFLWGRNQYNECIVSNNIHPTVQIPYCINDIIKSKFPIKNIQGIHLGYLNTKIIVKYPTKN